MRETMTEPMIGKESFIGKVLGGIIKLVLTLAKTMLFVLIGMGITWTLDYFLHTGFFIVPIIIGNGYIGLIKIFRERNEVDERVVYQHLPQKYRDEFQKKVVSRGDYVSYAGVILNIIGLINYL